MIQGALARKLLSMNEQPKERDRRHSIAFNAIPD